MAAYQFDNIADEFKKYDHWLCWRSEMRDGKLSKVPYDPVTGQLASVTHGIYPYVHAGWYWRKFEECVEEVLEGKFDGIGFVFAEADNYCGIDLDEQNETTQRIFDTFNSYTEYSPSGKGCHIIIRATIPSGARRDAVEMYSNKRYFTFTGNVIRNVPTVYYQELATILYHELKNNPVPEHLSLLNAAPATKPDEQIIREIHSAKNYPRFWALINGDSSALTGRDRSGSAIDMAIVDIIQKYSKDPNQIERLWTGTPHGQREKTQNRAAYRKSTIKRSFDQELKQIAFQFAPNPWQSKS
jgi:primase-polymerase (primpol)-like protein